MKTNIPIFLFILFLNIPHIGCTEKKIKAEINDSPHTFCNPVNLNYRFIKKENGAGAREGADPVVTYFKGNYYLFVSKSGGYWYSSDFNNWKFVPISEDVLPIEDYAPATYVHNDSIYYVGSIWTSPSTLYRSAEPEKGIWEPIAEINSFWDPGFFVEGNNLYLYYGCSSVTPIRGITLDLNTLEEKGKPEDVIFGLPKIHGWERTGEKNERKDPPFIEGAWMTKHNDTYYLQYAGPGTQWKTYADGVYTSQSPMGPFEYAPYNPISYKPGGFMGGAGHGCMFESSTGEQWRASTISISRKHIFERRIAFYPAGYDNEGWLYTNTYLGDYPMFLPGKKDKYEAVAWMLLSYNKPVSVSSVTESFPPENAVDEDIRTYWAAKTNSNSEWMLVDLLNPCFISAIQVNFGEHGSTLLAGQGNPYENYQLYASNDKENWHLIVDKSQHNKDVPHDYIEFKKPFKARYIKLQNCEFTCAPHFTVRDLRIFGKGTGSKPEKVKQFQATRNTTDDCKAWIEWSPVERCDGYVVRYGIQKDKLYNSYQVIKDNKIEIPSLNSETQYFYTIDAYNENGITYGTEIKSL